MPALQVDSLPSESPGKPTVKHYPAPKCPQLPQVRCPVLESKLGVITLRSLQETSPRAVGSGPGGGQDSRRDGAIGRAVRPHGHSSGPGQSGLPWPRQVPRSGRRVWVRAGRGATWRGFTIQVGGEGTCWPVTQVCGNQE